MTTDVGSQRTWMTAEDFWKQGLLYYVNSTVLWPLGLALAIEVDEKGNVKDGLGILKIEPAETMVDGFPEDENHPRSRATAYVAQRIMAMTEEEQQGAREVLMDPLNVAAFLADDPTLQRLARPDSSDGAV